MPHAIVKMHKGRTQTQKAFLAQKLKEAVMKAVGASPEYIRVPSKIIPPPIRRRDTKPKLQTNLIPSIFDQLRAVIAAPPDALRPKGQHINTDARQ